MPAIDAAGFNCVVGLELQSLMTGKLGLDMAAAFVHEIQELLGAWIRAGYSVLRERSTVFHNPTSIPHSAFAEPSRSSCHFPLRMGCISDAYRRMA